MSGVETLRGTWYVVPTPFGGDGGLDVDSQRRVADAAVSWGVDGLLLMGVTSEAPALTGHERVEALEAIAEAVGGRLPFVIGCSGASVEVVAERAQEATRLGAVAAMVAAPPLVRNVDALPEFYRRVAGATGLPLVIQDEPAATGVTLPVSVLQACVEAAGARVVKLEDPPTPPKIAALLAADPALHVLGGLGGAFALSELRAGACGTMTGFAFPEILGAVRARQESKDAAGAAALFDRFLPLIQFEAQAGVGLAIRKELLRRRGAIACAVTRGPTRRLSEATMAELDDVLARVRVAPAIERMEVRI